jgi:hypothetical protein
MKIFFIYFLYTRNGAYTDLNASFTITMPDFQRTTKVNSLLINHLIYDNEWWVHPWKPNKEAIFVPAFLASKTVMLLMSSKIGHFPKTGCLVGVLKR